MWNDIDRRIQRALSGVRQAFRGVTLLAKADGPVVLMQLDGLNGEPLRDIELMQHYGLTTVPPDGSMAVVLPLGGRTSHGVVIATEHGGFRLKGLKPGEVALYDMEGQSVVLRKGRIMELNTDTLVVNAAEKVSFNTPLIECVKLVATDDVVAAGVSSKNHTHPGVQLGGSNTPPPTPTA